MNSLQNLVLVVQVISALAIIGLVLLQHGKGADMGAAFGSGASGSLFGATGSSNFMSKSTGVAAAIFFITTLILANNATRGDGAVKGGVLENANTPITAPAPAGIPKTGPVAPAPAVTAPAVTTPAASSPAASAPAASAPAVTTPAAPTGQIPK
jgi:preprotein translocase subunit SecG